MDKGRKALFSCSVYLINIPPAIIKNKIAEILKRRNLWVGLFGTDSGVLNLFRDYLSSCACFGVCFQFTPAAYGH